MAESRFFNWVDMFQPWVGCQAMKRRPQDPVLWRVDAELWKTTMCRSVLEREPFETCGKVDPPPDPANSLTMNRVSPSQLTLQQVMSRRAQDASKVSFRQGCMT